jgi:hypothetical protein
VIRLLAVTTVLTVVYVTTQHPLAFVALAVSAAVLAWVGLAPEREELAEYRMPGGDQ